ncbi:sensor histidine kinase [Brevibacterium oceani]|uniref:sensor histidine kinase n=1 Tax=Brevibacterium oceani TaxID=358099 RepID=UPI001B32C825|nr:histidine kinase [Brevibacterium oceani]
MRRIIAWLWLVPVPLTFVFELFVNSDPMLTIGNVLAVGASLPILIRVQRATCGVSTLWIAVLGLVIGLVFAAWAQTMSLTVMWLSLVAMTMFTRLATSWVSVAFIVLLAAGNAVVPSLMPDGLIFSLAAIIVIVVAISIGLMLRFADRSLTERQATAAEAERRRIATELHDLIAHEVTGIVVLAQAAGRSDNAALTSTALHRIEESGTRALTEIRRLVSDTRAETGTRAPVASGPQSLRDRVTAYGDQASIDIADGLDNRTGSNHQVGSESSGETSGAPTPTTPGPALGLDERVWPVLDRVLVESLTNVRRHAGSDAAVAVRLDRDESHPETLVMTVTNGPGTGGVGAGSGTGLSSLRTRVSHLGGTVEAGPEPDGGWSVRTRLPGAAGTSAQASAQPPAQPPAQPTAEPSAPPTAPSFEQPEEPR